MGSVHYIERSGTCDAEVTELLVSRDAIAISSLPKVSLRLWVLLSIFALGFVGSAVSVWMKFRTQQLAEVAAKPGHQNLADSLGSLMQSFEVPIMLILMLVTLYAGLKLYRRYVKVNNPQRFRKSRSKA